LGVLSSWKRRKMVAHSPRRETLLFALGKETP